MTAALPLPLPETDFVEALEPELHRVTALVGILSRHRAGKPANADAKRALSARQERVAALRRSGLWSRLLETDRPPEDLACDAMAVALLPVVWPSQALSLAALQPGIAEPSPCQALLHELLMVSPREEIALHGLLSPAGSLLSRRWLATEGTGPQRVIRPGPRLMRRVLGEDGFGALPSGVTLAEDGTGPIPALILPDDTREALDEVASLARYALAHEGDPAMPGGPAVLLTGPPGTGKSLAARHLSREIDRPLFRLDLGTVVSKWLGETERNLSSVFDQMSGTRGAILIDECDALLGRRVSVKEGRDHYINQTVSHLLMLLERHRGPVWLTSNLRANLDDAYTRRFAAIVDFRRPDRPLRQRAWEEAIGKRLPEGPRAELAALAATVDLSVAEIASAAHYAAALAHGAGRGLIAADVARGVLRERRKATATFSRHELIALAPHLDEGPGR